MRNPFRRPHPIGDIPIVIPAPVHIDWERYAAMNRKRMARGAEPIPSDEWEQTIREMRQPQRHMTRAEVEASQVWLLKHNREPLTEREILELTGVNMFDFETIENIHRETLANAEAEIKRMTALGYPTPADWQAKAQAQADEARDKAIIVKREGLLQAVTLLRERHPELRWAARLNASPAISADKEAQMRNILAGVNSFEGLRRLHAEALAGMNPDEAGALYLETHGMQHLASLPHDELMFKGQESEWRQVAEAQRTRRAGEPLRRILADEADLQAAINEANMHPTSSEIRATAGALGLKVEHMPMPQADLRLPPADPIFD